MRHEAWHGMDMSSVVGPGEADRPKREAMLSDRIILQEA
jgi:hypothetical protein